MAQDVSALLGEKLLQGWVMLSDTCGTCRYVPLMRTRDGKSLCVSCDRDGPKETAATQVPPAEPATRDFIDKQMRIRFCALLDGILEGCGLAESEIDEVAGMASLVRQACLQQAVVECGERLECFKRAILARHLRENCSGAFPTKALARLYSLRLDK